MSLPVASRRQDNRELVALARGGGLNFIGAVVTQLATMGLLLYMTRDLPKTEVGLFKQMIETDKPLYLDFRDAYTLAKKIASS